MELIQDGRIDVGFLAMSVEAIRLILEPVLRERFVVMMPEKHRLAARQLISRIGKRSGCSVVPAL